MSHSTIKTTKEYIQEALDHFREKYPEEKVYQHIEQITDLDREIIDYIILRVQTDLLSYQAGKP